MKKFAFVLSLVIGAWVLSPTPEAQAWGRRTHTHSSWCGHSTTSVPELDPSAAGGAMILLLGGAAYIASRRREEDLV